MVDLSGIISTEYTKQLQPHDIFITLPKSSKFDFLRDIQSEVLKSWFARRSEPDTIIKLNVGSGKTIVGLLALQCCLHEGVDPALYICPNKQLTSQVISEAKGLGIPVTDDPRNPDFQSGELICVTNVHKLFNGHSVFGVGNQGVRIKLGSVVLDDVHSCIEAISDQFRIKLDSRSNTYKEVFQFSQIELKRQTRNTFYKLEKGDRSAIIEVPYWIWQTNVEKVAKSLQDDLNDQKSKQEDNPEYDKLTFPFQFLIDHLQFCRCVLSGTALEIQPIFPFADMVPAFSHAKRRIYLTATLADDTSITTHLSVDRENLESSIVPTSSQSMGDRLILLPQDTNVNFSFEQTSTLLKVISKRHNVVVVVSSSKSAEIWIPMAQQILNKYNIEEGLAKIRAGHVGLTVIVNRYDGIDLPNSACRVIAIFDTPDVESYSEIVDRGVLVSADANLLKQCQRIEQGMGRGVRSNSDYCVVLLCGANLTKLVKQIRKRKLFHPATQRQLDLSLTIIERNVGKDKQISVDSFSDVINLCLDRNGDWLNLSKKAVLDTKLNCDVNVYEPLVKLRQAIDVALQENFLQAEELLRPQIRSIQDVGMQAWLLTRLAEIKNLTEPTESQKILRQARQRNSNVLRPVSGSINRRISVPAVEQAKAVQNFLQNRNGIGTNIALEASCIVENLDFNISTTGKFENAIFQIGEFIGIRSSRPDLEHSDGPDNLWVFKDNSAFAIEVKSGVTSQSGITRKHLGQLAQSMSWLESKKVGNLVITAIIIHPSSRVNDDASVFQNLRVMTEKNVNELREQFLRFSSSLTDIDVANSVSRISQSLNDCSLTSHGFLSRFTRKL